MILSLPIAIKTKRYLLQVQELIKKKAGQRVFGAQTAGQTSHVTLETYGARYRKIAKHFAFTLLLKHSFNEFIFRMGLRLTVLYSKVTHILTSFKSDHLILFSVWARVRSGPD